MRTFVDTSALYTLLDESEDNHASAAAWFAGLDRREGEVLVTHNYVVVETVTLVHNRLGVLAVRDLLDLYIPSLNVAYVEKPLHTKAVAAFLAGVNRRISFVDRVSFEFMRETELTRAFAFDRDFERQGFQLVV